MNRECALLASIVLGACSGSGKESSSDKPAQIESAPTILPEAPPPAAAAPAEMVGRSWDDEASPEELASALASLRQLNETLAQAGGPASAPRADTYASFTASYRSCLQRRGASPGGRLTAEVGGSGRLRAHGGRTLGEQDCAACLDGRQLSPPPTGNGVRRVTFDCATRQPLQFLGAGPRPRPRAMASAPPMSSRDARPTRFVATRGRHLDACLAGEASALGVRRGGNVRMEVRVDSRGILSPSRALSGSDPLLARVCINCLSRVRTRTEPPADGRAFFAVGNCSVPTPAARTNTRSGQSGSTLEDRRSGRRRR